MVCMSKYVLKRLAMLIPVLIGVTFMVYFILSLSPGDTAAMIAGESADAETIEATRKDLGLDQPVIVQYGKYMLNLLHGDMGKSYKTKRDVFPTIMAAFPNTAKLAFWSILVAVAIALPIGIISATRQYSAIDNGRNGRRPARRRDPELLAGLNAHYRILLKPWMASIRRYGILEELHYAGDHPWYRRRSTDLPYDAFLHA